MSLAEIRVALVGVGNCASALVQGLEFYRENAANAQVPGLTNVELGGYRIDDIVVSAAFDVNQTKVSRDLSDAIFAAPNNTAKFTAVPQSKVFVQRGEVLDGIGAYLKDKIAISPAPPVNVVEALKKSETEIVVSFLPVGSQRASEYYADAAISAGCAYINCIPVFLASNPQWSKRFTENGLPIIGDDIKSQVGATIIHRTLAKLFKDRGVSLDRTYQLNFGGNTDFLNMLERERLVSKRISKTQSVLSQIGEPFDEENIHIGPSDHVAWLQDRKIAHIRLEGTSFGGMPLNVELKLEVWDSPNSAGIVVDAIRCAKIALDRNIGGPLMGPCGYYMKSPPQQLTEDEARHLTFSFVNNAGTSA